MQNSIFQFIQKKNSQLSPEIRSQITQNKTTGQNGDKQNFHLISLPVPKAPITLQGNIWNIAEHHISIYERYRSSRTPSDWHYTAILQTSGKPDRKLHVYYDRSDRAIMEQFSLVTSVDGANVPTDPYEQQTLRGIAQKYSYHLMTKVRSAQTQILELESKALFTKLADLAPEPETTIEALQAQSSQITEISNEAAKLVEIGASDTLLNLLSDYKTRIEWTIADQYQAQSAQTIEPAPLAAALPNMQLSIEEQATGASHSRTESAASSRMKKAPLSPVIQILNQYVEELDELVKNPTMDDQQLIAYYDRCLKAVSELVSSDEKIPAWQSIAAIHKHFADSKKLGVRRLTELLLDDASTMESIKAFQPFISKLPPRTLGLLVTRPDKDTENAEKLNLLLSENTFPINEMTFPYQGEPHTLLELCFARKLLACFNVLLAHGASLLVRNKKGYPLVYVIDKLAPEASLFQSALRQHILAMDREDLFVAQIAAALSDILHTLPDDDPDLSTLIENLKRYGQTKNFTRDIPPPLRRDMAATYDKLTAAVDKAGCSEARNQLMRDPSVQQALNELSNAGRSVLLSTRSKSEKCALVRKGQTILEKTADPELLGAFSRLDSERYAKAIANNTQLIRIRSDMQHYEALLRTRRLNRNERKMYRKLQMELQAAVRNASVNKYVSFQYTIDPETNEFTYVSNSANSGFMLGEEVISSTPIEEENEETPAHTCSKQTTVEARNLSAYDLRLFHQTKSFDDDLAEDSSKRPTQPLVGH